MKVEVARVDPELVRQLAVRERLRGVRPQRLEHAQAQRMAKRLQLIGLIEDQDVQDLIAVRRAHSSPIYTIGAIRPSATPQLHPQPRVCALPSSESDSQECPGRVAGQTRAPPPPPWTRRSR